MGHPVHQRRPVHQGQPRRRGHQPIHADGHGYGGQLHLRRQTSATGGNFGVGTGKKDGPDAHRKGTYSVEGYTLVLRYANGKVARLPFFMKQNKYRDMWFEGYILAKDDKK